MAKLKKLFRTEDGLRLVWRLAIGAAAYAAALYGIIGGLGWTFGKLFDAWGLTTSNLAYAPLWARHIVAWHTDFVYGLAYIASIFTGIAAAERLCGKAAERGKNRPLTGGAIALAMAVGLTAVSLFADSMRMELPFGEPSFEVLQFGALVVLILGKLSAEILTKRIVFDITCARAKRWPAYLLAVLVSMAPTAVWSHPLGVINALLMGLLGCVLYERYGLAASTAFQTVWSAWCSLVFRFPGVAASAEPVYALYHVSDAWLTGGNAGPGCGAWVTVFCSASLIWLCRFEMIDFATKGIKRRSSHGKDQNRNRRSGFQRRKLLR